MELTTGQMIDKLGVGEKAECIGSPVKGWIGTHVLIEHGTWLWENHCGKREDFFLSPKVQKNIWRIIPQYVTFEEAMKALKEGQTGKTVHLHYEGLKIYFRRTTMFDTIVDICEEESTVIPNMDDLINGAWTIEN